MVVKYKKLIYLGHITFMREKVNIAEIFLENRFGAEHFGGSDIDGRII
jgi:hypothetical protein